MSTTDSHQVRGGATLNNNTTVFSEISQDFISVPYKRLADFTESKSLKPNSLNPNSPNPEKYVVGVHAAVLWKNYNLYLQLHFLVQTCSYFNSESSQHS